MATCVLLTRGTGRALADEALASFRCLALAYDAEVVGRTGRFKFYAALHFAVIQPVEHGFILSAREHLLIGDLLAAADGDEQEQVQRDRAQRLRQLQGLVQVVQVVAG
ncbi:MAG: hypothetical protein C4309_08900, partial [Chloroflexota bacterium]